MATEVVHTVGTGKIYTTLNSWEIGVGIRRNLVTADEIEVVEVYGGNVLSASLSISNPGWTTDATRYIEIRAASGFEHTGVWNTSKAYASLSGAYLIHSSKHVRAKRMQFSGINANPYAGGGGVLWNFSVVDSCILKHDNNDGTGRFGSAYASITATLPCVFKNNIVLGTGATYQQLVRFWGAGGSLTHYVYNNTIIHNGSGGGSSLYASHDDTCITQNSYFKNSTGGSCYGADSGGVITQGANDATSNTEATTANLRSIAYSTANFLNVTAGSENLRLVVSQANKLLDNGANLSGSGVTVDIIGVARPQAGAFDIGAFENDIPICWNYTARYKNSNKLFKASGCGPFPRNLQVPSNVDTSTGKMVDDGIFISPDKYKIV